MFELTNLIHDHGVNVLTPVPTTVGGLAETLRVADRAEENYMPVSPHNVCSPVGTMACIHLAAAVPNFDVLEFHALEVDWWDDLHTGDDLIRDSSIAVPEAPGLGIELDEEAVEEHVLDGDVPAHLPDDESEFRLGGHVVALGARRELDRSAGARRGRLGFHEARRLVRAVLVKSVACSA